MSIAATRPATRRWGWALALRSALLPLALAAGPAALAATFGITGFAPRLARPGEPVLVSGTGLSEVTGLEVFQQRISDFQRLPGNRILFRMPDPGPDAMGISEITLIGPSGTASTREFLQCLASPPPAAEPAQELKGRAALPEILDVHPAEVRPGDRVSVTGRRFRKVVRVDLSQDQALDLRILDDTRLTFRVGPAGEPGFRTLVLRLASGGIASRRRAVHLLPAGTARPPAVPGQDKPVIDSLRPTTCRPGDRVTLIGRRLAQVTHVRLGERDCRVLFQDEHSLVFDLPDASDFDLAHLPMHHPVRLQYEAGTAAAPRPETVTHYLTLAVLPPAPVITSMAPARGVPGTILVLRGTHLGAEGAPARRLLMGSAATETFLKNTPTEIWAQVPAGAGGEVRLEALEQWAAAPGPFTLLARPESRQLTLAAAYITQGVQRRDGSVPLVAGRDGLLRMFLLAADGNLATPSVRVTLTGPSGTRLERVIDAALPGVPTEIGEDDLERSWNLRLPGDLIQPGAALRLEVLPGSGWSVAPGHPFAAPTALAVREVPPVAIDFIPIRVGETVGNVDRDGRSLEDWLGPFRKLFPVGRVEARVGEVFDATSLVSGDAGQATTSFRRIQDALEAKRLLEDPRSTRFCYGVLRNPQEWHFIGLSRLDRTGNLERTAVGWDGAWTTQSFAWTFAHEMGHSFGRRHTPAGDAPGADPDYKIPGGFLDAAGLDLETLEPKAPGRFIDLMGYGDLRRTWVSAFTWEGVLAALCLDPLAHPGATAAAGAPMPAPGPDRPPVPESKREVPGPARCLLVQGTLTGDTVAWAPVFQLEGRPELPVRPGPYRLRCLDRRHHLLLELPFDAPADPDSPAAGRTRSFSLLVPLTPELDRAFTHVEILRGTRRLDVVEAWSRGHVPLHDRRPDRREAPAGRDPVEAWAYRRGVVALRWEPREHPMLFVQDPRSGAIIARLEGGGGEIHTDAPELVLIRSNGWATDRIRVVVRGAVGSEP